MEDVITRTRALQTLAAGPFLCLGPHLLEFKPLVVAQQNVKLCAVDSLAAWRAAGALFFTIACLDQTMGASSTGTTVQVIYEHATDSLYFLRREAWISDMPTGTQLVGQYVEDLIQGQVQPNFMVFDIIKHNKREMVNTTPSDRYSILLALANSFNKAYMTLQWVGTCTAVEELLQNNRACIPHEIKYGLCLTKDPLYPSRLV